MQIYGIVRGMQTVYCVPVYCCVPFDATITMVVIILRALNFANFVSISADILGGNLKKCVFGGIIQLSAETRNLF